MKFTAEILREIDANNFAEGTIRWTVCIISKVDNHPIGLTEVYWTPKRPTIMNQGFTGIHSGYRNKGLGRWLKAEMMTWILNERPEVTVIRAENANSNVQMLKINTAIGFCPLIARVIWQVDTETVKKHLTTDS